MIPNIWLALRDDAQVLVVERLRWNVLTQGQYSGPITNRQARLFSYMADQDTTQRLFRVDNVGGHDWVAWNVYFNLPGNILQQARVELDQLIADYPNRVKVTGAWSFETGEQIKQGGVPIYPLHPRLIEFMPDVVEAVDRVETSRTRPTVLSDVILVAGQAPRDFS